MFALFDKPLYAQRRYFVQEITGLDDVFDFLDEWPQEKRNLAYETLVRYCREAANGRWPIDAVPENFRMFLKQNGKLAELEHGVSAKPGRKAWLLAKPVARPRGLPARKGRSENTIAANSKLDRGLPA